MFVGGCVCVCMFVCVGEVSVGSVCECACVSECVLLRLCVSM